MFRRARTKAARQTAPPPTGVSEIIFSVFDEKKRIQHHFQSGMPFNGRSGPGPFNILNHTEQAIENYVLAEAIATGQPASMAFSYGDGLQKFLYILPYERKKGHFRFACMQIGMAPPDPDEAKSPCLTALAEGRVCLLLSDSQGTILAASPKIPEEFGYTPEMLQGMALSDLFTQADMGMISACSADTNESILSCVFHCLDGSRRDVEMKKYSAPDQCHLHAICDVTRPKLNEEITQVSTRERRRIGQDLHDSIGQLLTGISLLSRSLANSLQRDGNPGDADAAQISELADDASNQIRQISRGLMPADIVHRGLFESLRELARITVESCGIDCEAHVDETVEFADGAVETHLFRIAQEAVNNSVRHAGASRIDIVVEHHNGMPQLTIRDNGSWKGDSGVGGGIGMKTMEYRASVIGGQLKVGAMEQGGTHVVCRLEMEELFETRL